MYTHAVAENACFRAKQAWARSYKKAMSNTYFPYFHVVQLGRMDMSKELLLGSILCAIFVLCLAVS
jgi:hypothetical protein